jgi:uncharacterized protein YecT (DUF1311 family)
MIMTILRATLFAATAAFAQTPEPPSSQSQTPTQAPAQAQTPAPAVPSFECSRAVSVVEKEICAISEFADLDSRIAKLYTQDQAIVSARDAEALRGDQKAWLRERDACGNLIHGNPPIYIDVYACLRDQLNRREAFLRVVYASKQFTKP